MSNSYGTEDLPITLEKFGFSPDQMTSCDKCGKASPPSRPNCLYCGTTLQVSDISGLRLSQRRLEEWEKGHNVIVLSPAGNVDRAADELASILQAQSGELKKLLAVGKPLPISRLATESEAEAVAAVLRRNGFATRIITDIHLMPEKSPIRLRGLELGDGFVNLCLFNTSEKVRLDRADIVVLVTGIIFESRTEKTERRKRNSSKVLDENETATDEPIVDIYPRNDNVGWRIMTKGFDYSCLGQEKGMCATDNMKRLASRLREFAPMAPFVDDYREARLLLGHCWPDERHSHGWGLQRTGLGRKTVATTISSSNLRQLNRYSRLQRLLL